MAIKRPDIYQHNNDKFAIVDSDYVRGGFRSVNNLNELYALYPNEDQLKQFVTQVYVINLSQFYLLVDKTKINGSVFLPEAWKLIESSGSGLTNLILSLTWEELITLKNASELIPGVTYKITDYEFISSSARLTASTKHIDILVNATSVNTLDENVSFYSEDFNTSGWSGKYTIDDVDKFDYIDISKKAISLNSITTVNKYSNQVRSSANSSTVLVNILQNSSYTRELSPIAPVLSNSFPYSGIWDTVSFQDGVFYVTGENQSKYLTSSDGITWSVNNILDSSSVPIVANWYKLIINNGIKYLFTKNSPYYYTESAGVWTRQSFPTLVDIAGVDVSTDIYVLPKTGKTLYKVVSNVATPIQLNSEGTSWNSLSVNSGKLYLGGAISAEYVVSNETLTNLPYFTNCLDLKAYNNIILGASTSGTLASINGVNYILNTSYTSSAFVTNFLSGYYIINDNQLNTLSIGEILNNCKGVIYELIDENDNKAPFDFKTMLIDGIPTFSQLNSTIDLSEIPERCTNNHIVNSPYTFPFLKLHVSTTNDKLKHLTIVGVNGINNITAAQQQLSDTKQIPHFCINVGNDIIYYKFTDNLHIDAKIYNTGTWNTYDASYDSLITTKLFTLGESSQSVKAAIDYLYTNKADLIEGKVPSTQLPSYVSQVVEVADYDSLPAPGISDTIYVTLDTDLTYRWGGTQYVEISPSLAIGELATTAYRGDRGKIAYEHSQSTGNPHQTKYSELDNKPTTLSGFGIETEVETKILEGIGSKQDILTAGNKIIIENNVISVEETDTPPIDTFDNNEVLEFDDFSLFPVSGDLETLYLALDTGKLFYWNGTQYIEIQSDNLIIVSDLNDLHPYVQNNTYQVLYIRTRGNVRNTSAYTFYVESTRAFRFNEITQSLVNRNGYKIRRSVDGQFRYLDGETTVNVPWQDYPYDSTKVLTESEYQNLDTKELRYYFCSDTNKLYYGDQPVGTGSLLIPILWNTLINHKESESLVPGALYRIIDYDCIVDQENVQSAGHGFDIIVQALSTRDLSETASAVQRGGDTYFSNSNLKAWELKYCLDNDISKYSWAKNYVIYQNHLYKRYPEGDNVYITANPFPEELPYKYCWEYSDQYIVTDSIVPNSGDVMRVMDQVDGTNGAGIDVLQGVDRGKGVIYYMKDEWGNECPYDFKNTMFKLNKIISSTIDHSAYNNLIGSYQGTESNEGELIQDLNDFIWCYTFDYCPQGGTLHEDATIKFKNILSNQINSSFNGFDFLAKNVFKINQEDQSISFNSVFGYDNVFNGDCFQNRNVAGGVMIGNIFGEGFAQNDIYNYFANNIVEYGCHFNKFGMYSFSNVIPSGSSLNIFEGMNSSILLNKPIHNCTFKLGASYINITSSFDLIYRTSFNAVNNNSGSEDYMQITHQRPTETGDYEWVVAKNSLGIIEQYCPEDHIGGGGGVNMISIAWSNLRTLRDAETLVPGQLYRIIDYECIVDQEDIQSAGHDFDIVVTALSTNELSESAKCVKKAGDTYFENAHLELWEIKYCIDNDITRFAWVHAENGKGVIYYMADNLGNKCSYDFKNIMFKRFKISSALIDHPSCNKLVGKYYGSMHSQSSPYVTVDLSDFQWCYTFDYVDPTSLHYDVSIQEVQLMNNDLNSEFIHPEMLFDNICLTDNLSNIWGRLKIVGYGNTILSGSSNIIADKLFVCNIILKSVENFLAPGVTSFSIIDDHSSSIQFSQQTDWVIIPYNTMGLTFIGQSEQIIFDKQVVNTVIDSSSNLRINAPLFSNIQNIRIKKLLNDELTILDLNQSSENYEWIVAKNSLGVLKQYCPEDLVP